MHFAVILCHSIQRDAELCLHVIPYRYENEFSLLQAGPGFVFIKRNVVVLVSCLAGLKQILKVSGNLFRKSLGVNKFLIEHPYDLLMGGERSVVQNTYAICLPSASTFMPRGPCLLFCQISGV